MRVSRLWTTLGLSFAALFGSLLPSVIATGATPAPAATWNAATNPAMEPTEGSLIACTSSNCYMGTDIGLVKSDLSMASWTTSAPGYSEVGQIFCTTSRCVQDNNYWTDATSTPVSLGRIAGTNQIDWVACTPSLAKCLGVVQTTSTTLTTYTTSWTGSAYGTPTKLAGPAPASSFMVPIACVSETACFGAIKGKTSITLGYSTNAGLRFTATKTSLNFTNLRSFQYGCVQTRCYILGSTASSMLASSQALFMTSTDGGATWTKPKVPSTWLSTQNISCPTATECHMLVSQVSGSGHVMAVQSSSDAGVTWTTTDILNSSSSYQLSCPAIATCALTTLTDATNFTTSVGVNVSTDGGATWSNARLPGGMASINDAACATTSNCVVVGDNGSLAVTHDGGYHWTTPTGGASNYSYNRVVCTGGSLCIASGVDDNSNEAISYSSDSGATWRNSTTPHSSTSVMGVSCPTTTYCVAVGNFNPGLQISTDGGASFTALSGLTLPAKYYLRGVSCVSRNSCLAAGYQQNAQGGVYPFSIATNDGAKWTQLPPGKVAGALMSVSCTAPGRCAALGVDGNFNTLLSTTINNGVAWSVLSKAATGGATAAFALTCSTTTQCVAVGDMKAGKGGVWVSVNAGATWTASKSTVLLSGRSASLSLSTVSCSSVTNCVASDQSNSIIFYRPTPSGPISAP